MLPAGRTEGEGFAIPTFDVVRSDVEGFMDDLWEFQSAFHDCFSRSEPRAQFFDSMVGQLSQLERKSIEPMALHVAGGTIRGLQRLLSDVRWDEQLSCVSRDPCMLGDRRLLRWPRLQITHHGVHDCQQLMPAGREGNLLRFARGQQALVKGFDHGIVARGNERAHIQHRPALGATSVHSPPAAQRPTVTVKGGNAHQGGERLGAQGAQRGDVA
jgi:DDE superfamily endonuclease